VLAVEFTVFGIPCMAINGGPKFKQTDAKRAFAATMPMQTTDIVTIEAARRGKGIQHVGRAATPEVSWRACHPWSPSHGRSRAGGSRNSLRPDSAT
jgi:predicted 3-demethylubiquinone-9 3-methyltransferase (glyoxalase superfamily)